MAGELAAAGDLVAHDRRDRPPAHGYTAAFTLCSVALAVGIVVGLGIPQRRPEEAFGPHAVGDPAKSAA